MLWPRQHIKCRDINLPTKVSLVNAMVFPVVIWMWELDCKESWVPKNWCFWTVMLEKSLESPLDRKEIQPVNPKGNQSWIIHSKDWCWNWNSNTLATWYEEPSHLESPWCWERLKEGGEGNDRGWDCWMASLTEWTWVWVNSRNWSWTGMPGMLQSMYMVTKSWIRLSY